MSHCFQCHSMQIPLLWIQGFQMVWCSFDLVCKIPYSPCYVCVELSEFFFAIAWKRILSMEVHGLLGKGWVQNIWSCYTFSFVSLESYCSLKMWRSLFYFRDIRRFRLQDEDYKVMCQRMFSVSSSADNDAGACQNRLFLTPMGNDVNPSLTPWHVESSFSCLASLGKNFCVGNFSGITRVKFSKLCTVITSIGFRLSC